MKLYYCFNGLFDYEYNVGEERIIETIYKLTGRIIEYEAVKFYLQIYLEDILKEFNDDAYWCYLGETKADIIDDKRLEKYLKTIKEENEILWK